MQGITMRKSTGSATSMIVALICLVLAIEGYALFFFGFFLFVGIGFWLFVTREKAPMRKTSKEKTLKFTDAPAYKGFNIAQKIIFWLFPLAILNLIFWLYMILMYQHMKGKDVDERNNYYVKGIYYFNLFALIVLGLVIVMNIPNSQ